MENENVEIGDFVECVRNVDASVVRVAQGPNGQFSLCTDTEAVRAVDFEGTVIDLNGNIMTIECGKSPYAVHVNKIVKIHKGGKK